MIKRLKSFSLLKTASVYTMSNILNALIPFFLMPVLTRYLTPVDYGITSMMQVMIGFLNHFVGLNLHGAIAVKYYKKDEIDFPKYVSSCFIILCGSSLCMIMIFIYFSQQISELTSFPLDWIWSILLICFGQFLINIVLTILQVSVRPKFLTIYNNSLINQCVLGDYTYIANDSNFSNTSIRKFCSIGPGVRCGMGMHPSKQFVSTHPIFFSNLKQAKISFADKSYFEELKPIKMVMMFGLVPMQSFWMEWLLAMVLLLERGLLSTKMFLHMLLLVVYLLRLLGIDLQKSKLNFCYKINGGINQKNG